MGGVFLEGRGEGLLGWSPAGYPQVRPAGPSLLGHSPSLWPPSSHGLFSCFLCIFAVWAALLFYRSAEQSQDTSNNVHDEGLPVKRDESPAPAIHRPPVCGPRLSGPKCLFSPASAKTQTTLKPVRVMDKALFLCWKDPSGRKRRAGAIGGAVKEAAEVRIRSCQCPGHLLSSRKKSL
jgi:hypothetical protein